MAAETLSFKLDGREYEVPDIADLDMDEWQVMYDYTGLVLDDFAPLEDEDDEVARQQRLRAPSFTRALLHIGLQRAYPDMKADDVQDITGKAKLTRVLEALDAAAPEGDASPPALTSTPEQLLQTSSDGSSANGSAVSPPSSDTLDDAHELTTTGESDTSSTSDQTSSVA